MQMEYGEALDYLSGELCVQASVCHTEIISDTYLDFK